MRARRKSRSWSSSLLLAAALGSFPGAAGAAGLPVRFEENLGQTDPRVRYLVRTTSATVFVLPHELVLSVADRTAVAARGRLGLDLAPETRCAGYAIRMRLVGASRDAVVRGEELLETKSHYLIGNDPTRWLRDVPTYGRVVVEGAYPGIDVVYGSADGALEYGLRAAPGADLGAVRMAFEGATSVRIGEGGDLEVSTPAAELRQTRPVAWREIAGARSRVDISFRLVDQRGVALDVRGAGSSEPVTVDPLITFGTYLGGSSEDYASVVGVDSLGSVYLCGVTYSVDFPVMGGVQGVLRGMTDFWVAKLNDSRTGLVYSTYLGGNDEEFLPRLVVDVSDGSVFLSGTTYSFDFPVVNALQPTHGGVPSDADACFTKLDPSGSGILFSSFLGGSDDDAGRLLATDTNGDLVLAGRASSPDFPLVAPLFTTPPGFAAKVTKDGQSLVYSTYIPFVVYGLALDGQGNPYLAGDTWFDTMPVVNAYQPFRVGRGDCVLMKLNSLASSVLACTYFGGSDIDEFPTVTVGPQGNVALAGLTMSWDFPLAWPVQGKVDAAYTDGFVAVFDPPLRKLLMSTYIGGTDLDTLGPPLLDGANVVRVAGMTDAPDMPIRSPIKSALSGGWDGYVAALDYGAKRLLMGSYLGGSGFDGAATQMCRESNGKLLVVGQTGSTDFPANPLFPKGLGYEAFLVELSNGPYAGFSAAPLYGVSPLTVQFQDESSGGVTTYAWTFGDGGTSTLASPSHTYAAPGWYDVTQAVTGPNGTAQEPRKRLIRVKDVASDFSGAPRIGAPPLTVQFTSLCTGSVQSYAWDFGDGGTSTAANPSHSYAASGRFTVKLTATGPTTQDSETKADYVLATANAPRAVAVGPGPNPAAPPRALGLDALGAPAGLDVMAYGASGYGVNVGVFNVPGQPSPSLLTGPGPSPVYGPHVRGFSGSGAPFGKVSFYAYGTLRYGVSAVGLQADADTGSEILTGAGPGVVFGPHVRGFNYDGGPVTAIPAISFYAYATPRYGVNVGRGNIGVDAREEVLTMPGPSASFGPQVRGFALGPPTTPMSKVNFAAFSAGAQYGGRIDGGDVDADGYEELLVGRGPGPGLPTQVVGFNYDDNAVAAILGLDIAGFPTARYGAEAHGVDLDGDAEEEVIVSGGPDPGMPSGTRGFEPTSVAILAFDVAPYDTAYGMHAAGGL